MMKLALNQRRTFPLSRALSPLGRGNRIRPSWFSHGLIALLLLLVFAGNASARTYEDVRVNAHPPLASVDTTHGYAGYTIEVLNRSNDQAHLVRLSIRGYGQYNYLSRISRTVKVGPGRRASVTLFQPPLPGGSSLHVTIDGQPQQQRVYLNAQHMGSGGFWGGRSGFSTLRVIAGTKVPEKLFDRLNKRLNPKSKSSSGSGGAATRSGGPGMVRMRAGTTSRRPNKMARADRPADDWPQQWLAYSSYDAIVLTADELEQLTGPAEQALWRYVRAGGQLMVLGEMSPPAPWRQWNRSGGGGEGQKLYPVGFGTCRVVTADAAADWSDSAWHAVVTAWGEAHNPWETQRNVTEANSAFPVIDELNIPVRTMLGVVAVFAVLIGPVNFFVLARLKRRIWLLWTVPLLALVFSAAVFGSALLSEGWNPRVRSSGITILDQPAGEATSIGWLGYYAPLTPGSGLRFDRQTELTPEVRTGYAAQGGAARTVDWTRGQHLEAGWLQARVPAHFLMRKSEPRRERVTVQRANGKLRATNGLGVRLDRLILADEQGRLYQASDLPPGAEVALERAGQRRVADNTTPLNELYNRQDWLRGWAELQKNKQKHLRPNTYLAVAYEPTPFVAPGLASVRKHRAHWLIYGVMGPGQ